MQLDGCKAVVTGAGSGIGRALAIALADKGAELLLVGRRLAPLEETGEMLAGANPARLVSADISTQSGRRAICDACQAVGRLDLLVNNAGSVASGPFESLDDAALERLFAVNVVAPMALVRGLLPLLRSAQQPRIVNIGSVFGDIGHPLFAAYSASKFALRGFSDALRRELAPEGIGVTYAAPRATKTAAADGFAHLVAPFGMRVDPPEVVAAQIVAAIERDAASVYARGPERLFVLVQRLLPRIIDRALSDKLIELRAGQALAGLPGH